MNENRYWLHDGSGIITPTISSYSHFQFSILSLINEHFCRAVLISLEEGSYQ